MTDQDIIRTVGDLNYSSWYEGCIEHRQLFEFQTNGISSAVSFMGVCVWNAEDDDRDLADDGFPIEIKVHLINKARKVLLDTEKRFSKIDR